MKTATNPKHVHWKKSIPFLFLHAVALIGPFLVAFSWKLVALCLGLYVIRMFAVTAGYHRYFSHKTYKLNRGAQFAMAFLGTTAVQKGVLWWAANHRHHHKFSDMPDDIHSPVQDGFWWSHIGWVMSDAHDETRWELIPDLVKFPELRILNRYHLVPGLMLATGLLLMGGMPALIWGFFVSTVLLFHGTSTINSLSHVFGSRRYQTTDDSRNNFLLALITLGEGWHNNHHCYMNSTRQGFYWWEIDMSYYALKALSWVGIVEGIKAPPLERLAMRRLDRHAPDSKDAAPLAEMETATPNYKYS